MKLNFSMIKNENIGFKYSQNGKRYSFCGKLLNVKQTKSQYEFFYEDNRMVIPSDYFTHLLFVKENENSFEKENDNYYFVLGDTVTMNGLIGFTMSDTYGFPIELTKEILEEKGYVLDIDGFELFKDLNRKKTRENSKIVTAF